MVVYYQIAGKQIGSHVLAMGVLGALFGGVGLATSGGSQPKPAAPPIQAASKDEETFIQYVLTDVADPVQKYYYNGQGLGLELGLTSSYRDFLNQMNGGDKKKDH
ncbi:hypothetical protein BO78DRAFT_392711 [Aspergillus sclerotiicarbonarius CBS 121057]|uniref:Uncharacterized protein n=1 Tax=Aspergillus sclerotiicarbonarius (strain CBS 121057 / IBT 28362) TaxID=1448318 RepID=A0A319F2F0_ASPSB|nr:hypothetical protein BO78DRAFT_392711 [Aspergillus sclerotiicarbonarius CBS 121057]